ncbi:triose-phosphate isomerase [Blattabacterium cuenoti]|uniref:triose-phosphate isomerase n=1 Tax=Blattabacterium cuenoti TaxID=1653831 RepID=UPI00163C68A4|nr:triose-phosphate isomerase [Blattabacterium cuenoti]
MKKKIIIANWKMNYNFYDTTHFLRHLLKFFNHEKEIEKNHQKIIIAPSYPFLHISNQIVQGTNIHIAAQNIHDMEKGSYTGEVSAIMLKSIGINNVILGHSERRTYFNETNKILLEKIYIALKNRLKIIFCIGETLNERNNNKQFISIQKQLEQTIFICSVKEIENFIIAYEPIWAIGTGEVPYYHEVQKMHNHIRLLFKNKYGKFVSDKIHIVYGGSITELNCKEFFKQKDVDGGLVGNSSLNINKFLSIIKAS